jgi:cellulose synthase/poly-beta-1,6-N-acetylglucosamine synthase-like glycosyltransferase
VCPARRKRAPGPQNTAYSRQTMSQNHHRAAPVIDPTKNSTLFEVPIIIPCYNEEKTLGHCIKRVLAIATIDLANKGYALAAHEELVRQLVAEQPDITLAELKALLAKEKVKIWST